MTTVHAKKTSSYKDFRRKEQYVVVRRQANRLGLQFPLTVPCVIAAVQ